MAQLTASQARYLAEVRAAGPKGRRYNGRARRPLTALKAAGLVDLVYDQVAHASGNHITITEVFIATARPL